MTISQGDVSCRRTKRRLRRHGTEYDLILEHFIDSKPVPGHGVLVRSHTTGKYVWYNRLKINMPFYDGNIIPDIVEGVKTYTPDKTLVYEYLDHLLNNVLSKRDQKRFGVIYEQIKDDQLSLFDRLNSV